MSGQRVKFGLVGAGAVAHSYAQAFTQCDSTQLMAVADIRASAAQALAASFGCRGFDSYQSMAKEAALEAVVVCTPPVTHPEISVYFLERNVHVLCEKPLSIDVKSAKKMLDTARKTDTLLTMASKFRYVEDIEYAKSVVTSGALGAIVLFENAFTSRVDMTARWNANPAVSGGGVLIDNGTHSVDLMRYFLGPLAEVRVVEGKRIQGLAVEDTVRIFVRSVNGVMGSIDLSWSIDKELASYLNIYGSHGTISVGWKESKYRQSSSPQWVVFGQGYNKIRAFRRQLANFSHAIRGEETLLITPDDALASVEVIAAAYAALRYPQWTAVGQQRAKRQPAQSFLKRIAGGTA